MYELLRQREADGQPIRVALVGAGAMGVGIAWQIGRTPGMVLAAITDIDKAAAAAAAEAYGAPWRWGGPDDVLPGEGVTLVTETPFYLHPARPELGLDVLVEATNTIGFAGQVCEAAIEAGLHVVLMNAEVDLALGPTLARKAAEHGVVVTSDAGDQHGVLARMIDEIRLWGFEIRMAGNIKGFLDRYATAGGLIEEARIRQLNPIQCCAYTDGTKLGIEMAVIANGEGLVPFVPGMEGPRAADVKDVFDHFDFDRYGDQGVVDYILGAQPGGGVFVVGRCEDPLQARYLWYYKMGDGPDYLFYRPYHLCHLETTRAIADAALRGEAVLAPRHGRLCDVYAYAKRDVSAGEVVPHGIGGDHFYGLIERCADADARGAVPIALLEAEGDDMSRLLRGLRRDAPLTFDDITLPRSYLVRRFHEQQAAQAATTPAASRP
jgi:predicted homoserine dehydrogenase-like protein